MESREIILVAIDKIKPYENNPRINNKAVIPVMNSIKEYVFNNPITVDKDYVIITGHTRYKAAKKLGLEQVPVVILHDLTPQQGKQ
jgi:ParB-like chromosome segregation protein Spo0J